jgi:hypothetical protein
VRISSCCGQIYANQGPRYLVKSCGLILTKRRNSGRSTKSSGTELTKIGDQILTVVRAYVEQYSNLTDSMADELATRVLGIEQQRNGLKKKYYDRVKNSMGAVMAMRFLQVESQLERLVNLQIAAELPVDSQ